MGVARWAKWQGWQGRQNGVGGKVGGRVGMVRWERAGVARCAEGRGL